MLNAVWNVCHDMKSKSNSLLLHKKLETINIKLYQFEPLNF